jgi:hypothetical protein
VGVPKGRRARDKDSHRPPALQAVPAEPDQLSGKQPTPGAHNPESSVSPPSRKPIFTTRALAMRADVPVHRAQILADLYCRTGIWEPYGVLPDGTPTYTLAETAPTVLVVRFS